jgi:hypothetical protein
MLYQRQHNRLSHGDTVLYITTAINRILSRFRSSVDVAGAAAVAALAAVALASVDVAAVAALASAAVAASAAGTTKQPTHLFLMLLTELKKISRYNLDDECYKSDSEPNMLLDDKLEQFRSIDSLAKYYAS